MNIFIIYKQILDAHGQVLKIELVECDTNELMAQRFSKLYSLQTPVDLKNKMNYQYLGVRVS
jgi:hypothetical protein